MWEGGGRGGGIWQRGQVSSYTEETGLDPAYRRGGEPENRMVLRGKRGHLRRLEVVYRDLDERICGSQEVWFKGSR